MVSKRHYIPHGIDLQGRRPEAAAADTGSDDDSLYCAEGVLRAMLWVLSLYAVGVITWLVLT